MKLCYRKISKRNECGMQSYDLFILPGILGTYTLFQCFFFFLNNMRSDSINGKYPETNCIFFIQLCQTFLFQLLQPGYSFYTWPAATVLAWYVNIDSFSSVSKFYFNLKYDLGSYGSTVKISSTSEFWKLAAELVTIFFRSP